jgi:hypothetical protein
MPKRPSLVCQHLENLSRTALEQEIDRLVYALYGLTPEEIQIVENSTQRP